MTGARHRPHTGRAPGGRTFAGIASGHGSLDWAGGTGRALSLRFPHLHLSHPPFSFRLPCPRTWSSPPVPCCLLPARLWPLALPAGQHRREPAQPPARGVHAWHIPPLFCSSIINRISSACCTRRTHGIFCSNGAARFPHPAPVCAARGAREREVLLLGTQGIAGHLPCSITSSKPRAPAPWAPGTALHCQSHRSHTVPGVGSSWFRPMPPSPAPRGCFWPGGKQCSWPELDVLWAPTSHPAELEGSVGTTEPGTSAERFPNKNVFLT